ncbi:hypothetical protein [Flavobacterium gelatinilyticum]|uniref:hypothetical protein n=1 Tax=Flavobacterium gelatinilyticum TaxID=3003260 RepID=UPI0024809514|nr:hypothetical protein [Flavobacterium gelatinilyticum]
MNQDLKVENIDLIVKVLERPSIFSVQKVEDFFLFFNGYKIARNDSVVSDFLDDFQTYIQNAHENESLKDYSSEKIIRICSANDLHSLQLLKSWINDFINSNKL